MTTPAETTPETDTVGRAEDAIAKAEEDLTVPATTKSDWSHVVQVARDGERGEYAIVDLRDLEEGSWTDVHFAERTVSFRRLTDSEADRLQNESQR